jgi:hypothetical protein
MRAFAPLIPADVHVFGEAERSKALAWIAA